MKWTYDPRADAIYLDLVSERTSPLVSVGISDQVILDVDGTGRLAGIEIVGGTETVFPKLRRLLDEEPWILRDEER
jgi:uncharacterized protein YuzE